jgi:hypothetical protein
VAFVVALAGCGIFGRSSGFGGSRPLDSAVGGDPSVTPFRLDVLEEANNGENLTIKGQLTAKTKRSAKDALVRMTAVDTGGEQRISIHKVADLVPGSQELQPGKPLQFSLAIPSQGVSNYQVEVLWGKDAAPYLGDQRASMKQPAAPSEYLALRNLEVHRVPDGSCSSPEECLVTFSIKGEFFNSGSSSIKDVSLVAGFAPAMKMDQKQQPLENERRIEVRNLALAPQATKPFRLTLEKLLPASDTVAYQPVVRIVSFDSE